MLEANAVGASEGQTSRHSAADPRSIRRGGISITTKIHRSSPERRYAEMFLEDAYSRAFRARLRTHLPTLMSASGPDGRIGAVIGFRVANEGRLFLERYLDVPIEHAIADILGERVQRDQIAEIGGLASDDARFSPHLFVALAETLGERGCTHAVATMTRPLRRKLGRIGLATRSLAPARRSRLVNDGAEWGFYYDHEPEVVVGGIASAIPPLRRLLSADADA